MSPGPEEISPEQITKAILEATKIRPLELIVKGFLIGLGSVAAFILAIALIRLSMLIINGE